jgi:hypothetical protein
MKAIKRLILPFLLFCSSVLFGAELVITVVDDDLGIPLEGAKIVSQDGKTILCDSRGRAVVEVPENRTVILQVTYPGYENKRLAVQSSVKEYKVQLRLGGVMQARELVIEEQRPDTSETVIGRSVGISGRDLTRQAESGLMEDVMRAVKLLPGVGYVGGYMAMPSVRGGEPEDVTAVFDGFYVERPYHWGGAFSIFDPKMVESAQLSHGVFSARYGQTISGFLNIKSKKPSKDTASAELAISSSAANLNLSFPLGKMGGMALMGRVTYWDPFIEAAKLFYEEVNYITTAPYIRSSALCAYWDFSTDLSLNLNGFFGGDGIGVHYKDYMDDDVFEARFAWDNKIGFLASSLNYSPRQELLLKTTLGVGLLQSDLDGKTHSYNSDTDTNDDITLYLSDITINLQGRFDVDLELGKGFIFSAGIEEKYSRWKRDQYFYISGRNIDLDIGNDDDTEVLPSERNLDIMNHGFFSSLYSLVEYTSENNRLGVELGIRADHFLLSGEDFTLKGIPVVNPRINVNYKLLEDVSFINLLTVTAGSGLFSTVNSDLQNISGADNIRETEATQNRSWTSVVGARVDFTGFTFTLEGYIKNVFNRAYSELAPVDISDPQPPRWSNYFFDGKAFIWGFDLMLQKMDSRYWDGWISYSYIDAKYKNPQSTSRSENSGDWYYPNFHRFHTLNIIVNYKPVPAVHLNTRFSLASGIPIPKTEAIIPDPLYSDAPPPWVRIQAYDDHSRAGLVLPLDVKLSLFSFNKEGKVQREIYFSFENLLSLAYTPAGPKDFDENTGRETPAYSMVSYDLPIPLLAFGLKWSF